MYTQEEASKGQSEAAKVVVGPWLVVVSLLADSRHSMSSDDSHSNVDLFCFLICFTCDRSVFIRDSQARHFCFTTRDHGDANIRRGSQHNVAF